MNHIPNIEETNTRELRYCRNCNQMTNHNDTTCLKCGLAKETHDTREIEEIIEEKIKGYYEDIEQHERTKQAIKNKEIVYIGEFGNVLCEEDYFAWEEWVDSVAIGGSSREKFIKVNLNLHHQLQKAREEERERVEKDLDRRLEIQKKVLHSEYEGGYTHALQDVKEAIHSELDQDKK